MDNTKKRSLTGSTFGLILILVGGLILLKNLEIIDFNISRIIFSFPMFLLLVGTLIIVNSRKMVFGWLVFGFGLLLMMERMIPEFYISKGVLISIVIIGLGIYIIFKNKSGDSGSRIFRTKSESFNKDIIDDVSIFGGGEKTYFSENFKGGSITAIFGGAEIDLTKCKLAEGDNVIEIFALFGGAEIHVPKEWNVLADVVPIFGGVSNKTKKDPIDVKDLTRTLYIKGTAMFGGCEVKSH